MKSLAGPGDTIECASTTIWIVKEVKLCKVTKQYYYSLSRSKDGMILKYAPEIEINKVNGKKV